MVNVVYRIVVPFSGGSGGTGPLSWGQLENWSAIVRLRTWMPLGGVMPLPAGTTVEDYVRELQYLMGRYEPMRTRLRFPADGGRPVQVVHPEGEITLEVVDAGDADPVEVGESVRVAYEAVDLDFAAEWPLRVALIRHRGSITHIVALISHFVTDAAGGSAMLAEVSARVSAPVEGMQPLAQAAWQASPGGRRQNEAALRHWRAILETMEPRRFPPPTERTAPRYWRGEFTSSAVHVALRVVMARTGSDSAAILLTAYAAALANMTGINPVVVRPLVGNRFRPGLSGIVCTATQASICALDVAGRPFDEALVGVRRSSLAAFKNGYFDADDVTALIAEISADRGVALELGCFINDRRTEVPMPAADHEPIAELVRDAMDRTTFEWVVRRDSPSFEPMIVDIDDADDAIRLTVHMDTEYISPADAETFLRGMEDVLVAATGIACEIG